MASKVLIKGSDFMSKVTVDAIDGKNVEYIIVKLYTDGKANVICSSKTTGSTANCGVTKSDNTFYVYADAAAMKNLADGIIRYEMEVAVSDSRFANDGLFNRIFSGRFDVSLQSSALS